MSYVFRVFDGADLVEEIREPTEQVIYVKGPSYVEVEGVSHRELEIVRDGKNWQFSCKEKRLFQLKANSLEGSYLLQVLSKDGRDCYLFNNLNANECDEQTYPLLTARETECLLWLAKGARTLRISHELAIKEVTVNMHVNNAKRKLRAMTREEAVAKAVNVGFLHLHAGN